MCLTYLPSDMKVGTCTIILSLKKKIICMTGSMKDKVKHMTLFSIFCASITMSGVTYLFNDCFQGYENES